MAVHQIMEVVQTGTVDVSLPAGGKPGLRSLLRRWLRPGPTSTLPARFHLEAPTPGQQGDGHLLDLRGWLSCPACPVEAVELPNPMGATYRFRPTSPPATFAQEHPELAGLPVQVFHGTVSLLGQPAEADLPLGLVVPGQQRLEVATIKVRRQLLGPCGQPGLRALMLNAIGRSGTTLTMSLLREHPAIVVAGAHPHEVRTCQFWMHLLHLLAAPAPANHPLQQHLEWLGYLDPRAQEFRNHPELRTWFGTGHLQDLAAACQAQAEAYYQQVAVSRGQDRAVYFAEKVRSRLAARLVAEFYPESREIFLVRDFRDTICSMQSFNRKRGFLDFGRQAVKNDEEHIAFVGRVAAQLAKFWQERRHCAHLIRYEDLVQRPEAVLPGVFRHLGLDADPALVARIVQRVMRDPDPVAEHRTSRSPEESIGRWRREMEPGHRDLCQALLGPSLEQFGYDPDVSARAA